MIRESSMERGIEPGYYLERLGGSFKFDNVYLSPTPFVKERSIRAID